MFYKIIKSPFGRIGVVWRDKGIKVVRIVLTERHRTASVIIKELFPYAHRASSSNISGLCNDIIRFLHGEPVVFSLKNIDLLQVRNFQKKVLLLERKIPRGQISTYGRLAHKLGHPGAARAVGSTLAKNPFPIIIPCHRTIKADGSPGGYIGGPQMKRKLLELEGIKFDQRGNVVSKKTW